MAQLYDEICRTLATPMPRSRALKLIFGGLARARFWLLSVLDNRIRHSSAHKTKSARASTRALFRTVAFLIRKDTVMRNVGEIR